MRTVYDILGAEEEKCLARRATREREEEEGTGDVVGGEKQDGGAAQVGGASVAAAAAAADGRQTRREAVEVDNENPSRAKGEWARAIGYFTGKVRRGMFETGVVETLC